MKPTTCKRCQTPNLFWTQSSAGKWKLQTSEGEQHHCDSDTLKAVKCKYCSSDDLHWAEELKPDGTKKMVLTESYGLPHACDERLAFIAKEKQDKKDKYEAIKARVTATPDGPCKKCKGNGTGSTVGFFGNFCEDCNGHGHFSGRTRRDILAAARNRIWPNMTSTYYSR